MSSNTGTVFMITPHPPSQRSPIIPVEASQLALTLLVAIRAWKLHPGYPRHLTRDTGLLRLTSAEETAPSIAPVVAEYVRRHPGMQVEYRPSDRLIDRVAEGMDLSLRTTGRRDSSLRAVSLALYDVWCVAAPDYLQRRGTPRRLRDLAAHDWIAFTPIPHPWTLHTRDGRQSVRLRRTVSTSSTTAGRALAVAGAGVFAVPRFAVEGEVATGRLVRLLAGVRLPQVSLYAAWPGQREPPSRTRAFIELAKARLGNRN